MSSPAVLGPWRRLVQDDAPRRVGHGGEDIGKHRFSIRRKYPTQSPRQADIPGAIDKLRKGGVVGRFIAVYDDYVRRALPQTDYGGCLPSSSVHRFSTNPGADCRQFRCRAGHARRLH
ncbi:hypothetical protein NG819_05990 [Pseudarthrobacter sp. Fe7]|nr:hypothetical protein NG819_05990 [Pseudarthrobacter sp. Fe7]